MGSGNFRTIEKQVQNLHGHAAVIEFPYSFSHWATGKANAGYTLKSEERPAADTLIRYDDGAVLQIIFKIPPRGSLYSCRRIWRHFCLPPFDNLQEKTHEA